MRVIVHDSNVLIDLLHADLLKLWAECGIEINVSILVFSEIQTDAAKLASIKELVIHQLEPDDLVESLGFYERHPDLSLPDCSCIPLAMKHGVPLLTGDKLLRRIASSLGIEVRGMLWVLDQLLESELIDRSQAVSILELLINKGSRYPMDEVQKRLKAWSSAR